MSERSSVISVNDRLGLIDTDTDGESDQFDTHKYMMPNHTQRSSASTLTPDDSAKDNDADDTDAYNSDYDYTTQLSRTGSVSSRYSIYSLSRVSFASQLAQLGSIQLPDATSLSARISCMPTSSAAAAALKESADQIRRWIRNAHTVLQGLDAEDDVEWAAAGGRDGLDHVDRAVRRFDKVVKLYVLSVEELHLRHDIATLPKDQVQANSDDMEVVVKEWQKIKDSLAGVKEQVEIAMEWEELSNSVGTGIAYELDDLAGLVFEMEEQRHQSVASNTADTHHNIDIDELKTIVDEKAGAAKSSSNPRLSLPPPFSSTSALQTSPAIGNVEDNLLALFARMQPLRASLDFLPMRLSVFHCRGNTLFPTACLNLEAKRDSLEAQWKKLEADAEALRRELGEDRWLLVFRNAGKQASKMCQSVSRSAGKLRSAIDHAEHHTDPASVAKMVESYEAKKNHYGTAIERVLAIIDRGVLDRLTVNGEILGLQSDMKRKWAGIQAEMRELDSRLMNINLDVRNQQLRDSVSTIVSSEHSMNSSFLDTPRSSSASSISRPELTPRRSSRFTRFVSAIPRRTPQSKPKEPKSSSLKNPRSTLSPSYTSSYLPYTPPPATDPLIRQFKAPSDKPRWNITSNTRSTSLNSLVPPAPDPSPYRRVTIPHRPTTPHSASSKIPTPSSFSRSTPGPSSPATPSRRYESTPLSSPVVPRAQSSLAYRSMSSGAKPRSSSSSHLGAPPPRAPSALRKTSYLSPTLDDHNENDDFADLELRVTPKRTARAASALSTTAGNKSSMFGFSRGTEGRRSRLDATAGAAREYKPVWR